MKRLEEMKRLEAYHVDQVDISLKILTAGAARIGGPIDAIDPNLRYAIVKNAEELISLLAKVRERVPVQY
jgi:hypothetical protein